MSPRIFPTVLMVLDFCAAVPYGLNGDWRKVLYWTCAGLLTWSVTW